MFCHSVEPVLALVGFGEGEHVGILHNAKQKNPRRAKVTGDAAKKVQIVNGQYKSKSNIICYDQLFGSQPLRPKFGILLSSWLFSLTLHSPMAGNQAFHLSGCN